MKFKIIGGRVLDGTITPQGAKNEALQIICATLLTSNTVTVHNVPDILDVNRLISLLELLGTEVNKIGDNSYQFTTKAINLSTLDSDEYINIASKLRGSLLLLGPLLARSKYVKIPSPGGDRIGRRRLDTHFIGVEKLGAKWKHDIIKAVYVVHAHCLKGTYILLDEASVTATANVIMAAMFSEGVTTIYHAACEPHIQQLCHMLNAMGGCIEGIGSNLLTIQGVQSLAGTTHTISPDIIEIGSFIGLATVTQSDLTIKGIAEDQLGLIPHTFRKLGVKLEVSSEEIRIPRQETYQIKSDISGGIPTISDGIWPSFPADLISIALVTAIQANGSVLIHQKLFESRLFFVDKLIEMGAQIILCDPHRANVIGINRKFPLRGITASSPDIRAGIALLISALAAEGESIIENIEQIDRGYDKIDERLRRIGASIERI